MPSEEYKSLADDFVTGDELNTDEYFVRTIINDVVHVAMPVVVTSVERNGSGAGGGYVSVKPLLKARDANGNGLNVVDIPRIPYFRLQHGTAAFICDPKIGDIGLAIVANRDISNINGDTTPKVPATFRSFDPSDSFYVGGFWGKTPTVFIHIEDDGNIEITAPEQVTVNAKTVAVNATTSFTVDSPIINLNGAITGGGSKGLTASFSGSIKADKDITAGSVSLQTHTHSGVQTGSGSTGSPNS